MSPFDIIKDLNKSKKQVYKKHPFETKSVLPPFLLNRSMSRFADTIMYANSVNHMDLPIEWLCDYYHHAVSPANRFRKWVKTPKEEYIDIIAEHFQCNKIIARQYLELMKDPKSVIDYLTRGQE